MGDPLQESNRNFGLAPRRLSWWSRFTYLCIPMPRWLEASPSDKLNVLFQNLGSLFREGRVVWGHVVQANELMFVDGAEDCPGEVVYSLADAPARPDPESLEEIAHRLYSLKSLNRTRPKDPQLAYLAHHFADEMSRVFGLPVPSSISPKFPCQLSTTLFVRKHLPGRRLCSPFFPLIVHPRDPFVALPLPERYWPADLRTRWREPRRSAPRAKPGSNAGIPSEQVTAMFRQALIFGLAEGQRKGIAGVLHEVRGTDIIVSGHSFTVSVVLDTCLQKEGLQLCAARFEVSTGGRPLPALTFGVIGEDPKMDGAVLNAVSQWYGQFCVPFLHCLARGATSLAVGEYLAYPGAMMTRGEDPGGWLDFSSEMHHRILNALSDVIRSHPVEVSAVILQLLVNPDGTLRGECRINWEPSDRLLEQLRAIEWPRKGEAYMFKQAYLLKPTFSSN